MMNHSVKRCAWCSEEPIYQIYHDEEWGVPTYDDQQLFEMLVLEGAQAGLSWIMVLKRREGYRQAFDHFDVQTVAQYTQEDIDRLKQDTGIIRNQLKIKSAIKNAQVFIEIQKEFGSFSNYLWAYVNHQPIINHFKTLDEVPASTPLSLTISKDLKKRGMSFVGETIIYAYMQAVGMVNDHTQDCDWYAGKASDV